MSGHTTSAINNYVVRVEEGLQALQLEDPEDALQRNRILVRERGMALVRLRGASAFVRGVLLDEAASDSHLISTVQD